MTPGTIPDHPPCPFCRRPTVNLMVHHLVPKEFGGSPATIDTCRDCHKAIHTLFSNRELKDTYHTAKVLRANEKFTQMVAYIIKQDPGGKVRFRRPRSRRRRR